MVSNNHNINLGAFGLAQDEKTANYWLRVYYCKVEKKQIPKFTHLSNSFIEQFKCLSCSGVLNCKEYKKDGNKESCLSYCPTCCYRVNIYKYYSNLAELLVGKHAL